jgi:hypothetical protein
MKLVKQKLIPCQMKLGQPRESHPFDLITHHLSEIAKQLIRQRMRKEPQARATYLALKFKVLLFLFGQTLVRPQGFKAVNLLIRSSIRPCSKRIYKYSIFCLKGRKTQIINARSPKCPKSYKKVS